MINLSKIKEPYIISEIGSNHNGDMKLCERLIKKSKEAGANAVKFQFFTINSLFSETCFKNNKLSKKEVKKYTLNVKNIKFILSACKKINIDVGFTPFGFEEIKILKKFNIDFYKVASMDCNNYRFIETLAKLKKPLIISTGLSTYKEIKKALNSAKKFNKNTALLHCVSLYPPLDKQVNLKRINTLHKLNDTVGFSDHSSGIDQALASIALGSSIIEKHFTINKKLKGWDHSMSIDFKELKDLVLKSKKIYNSLGTAVIRRTEPASQVKLFRRSIVANNNIKKGEVFSNTNLVLKRPGNGLEPIFLERIFRKKSKKNINKGTLILKSFF